MNDLLAARWQMTISLAFHMIFAAVGIGLPLLLVIVEGRYLRTRDPALLALCKRWSKTVGLLFAVGAVSGTALSLELGLLWPYYMEIVGASVGHFFGLEAFAFFIEAVFIGLYLYGWDRLSPRAHWLCGVVIAVTGALSGALVLGVNAWMQEPVGFTLVDGRVEATDPWAVFKHERWWHMAWHSTLACYLAVSFAVAGWYARHALLGRHGLATRTALIAAMSVGGIAALLQGASGDFMARLAYRTQPVKFAAMEGHFKTERYAPLHLGGWPDAAKRETLWAIKIPGLLSFLATHDPSAEIRGLDDMPRDVWPNLVVTHFAFQTMVGAGTALVLVTIIFWGTYFRRRGGVFHLRWLLWILIVASPLGFLGLEAGWFLTEAGRQPWAIYNVMRTAEAVTPAEGIPGMFVAFTLLYLMLAVTVVVLVRRLAASGDPLEIPSTEQVS